MFLPAHRDKSEDVPPSREVQFRAELGYRLLTGIHQVPGKSGEQGLDEEAILEWIEAVRTKAAEVDRAALADEFIGHLLAHASTDSEDGGWPDRIVRNVIEKLACDDVDGGVAIERFNMRGVTGRAMFEGGGQERALARQYRHFADISRSRWPRVARLLEMIAEDWDEFGHREDVRAEQDKLDL